MEIGSFSGDRTRWRTFYDSFVYAVHDNNSLPPIQKINYLINLLKGEAAETVKGLTLKNENYENSLDLLKERFGDSQVIISADMNNLLLLSPVRNITDVKSLRKLCDLVKSQIRGLESINIQARNYGPLLIPVILSKLPDEIKLIISHKFGNNIWDAEKVLETLEHELTARYY